MMKIIILHALKVYIQSIKNSIDVIILQYNGTCITNKLVNAYYIFIVLPNKKRFFQKMSTWERDIGHIYIHILKHYAY